MVRSSRRPGRTNQRGSGVVGAPPGRVRVIARDEQGLALDVCWTHALGVVRPDLTGVEALSSGDDRYSYLTVDLLHRTVQGAAETWTAWAALLA